MNFPKAGLTVRNASSTSAEILIYDQIGEDPWFGGGMSAKKFAEELKNLPKNITDLSIRINSPGGSVFDGMTIYERLKGIKATKTVYVDGLCASIASVIAMAGDKIVMGAGAQFMIHLPMTGVWGNRTDFESAIEILDKIEDQMTGIYARKTGLSRAELAKMLAAETWMTAEEALEQGFATELSEESLPIAASAMKSPWFRKAPVLTNTVETEVKAKAAGLRKNIEDFLARK